MDAGAGFRETAEVENDYRLGEWTVRPKRGSIERDDDVVHLKPKVMAVLNCLAAACNEVVERDVQAEGCGRFPISPYCL